jgi:hypothetical protein
MATKTTANGSKSVDLGTIQNNLEEGRKLLLAATKAVGRAQQVLEREEDNLAKRKAFVEATMKQLDDVVRAVKRG